MAKKPLPKVEYEDIPSLKEALSEFSVFESVFDAIDTKINGITNTIKKIGNVGKAFGGIFRKKSVNPVWDVNSKTEPERKVGGDEASGKGGAEILGKGGMETLESIEKWTKLQYELWGGKIDDDEKQRKLEKARQQEMLEELLAKRDSDGLGGGEVVPHEEEKRAFGFFQGIVDTLLGLANAVMTGLGAVTGILISPIAFASGLFEGLRESFAWISKNIKPISKAIELIKTGISSGPFSKLFVNLGKVFSWIKKMWDGGVGKAMSFISNAISKGGMIGKFLGQFVKIVKFTNALGKLAGPVGLVITVVDTIFRTISGMIDGFKSGGILGMLKGGIKGLFDGLIGGLLDALKNVLAWILDLIGLDSISKMLRSFSFVEVFNKFIDSIFSIPIKITEWIKDTVGGWISDMWSGLVENLKNITKVVWDYSPLGMIVNTISKVINYFKQQEGDTIFGKLKAGMSNIKKGFGRWLIGIIPDVFGLGWLRSSIAKIFGVDVNGNSTDNKNGSTTTSSVDTDEKTGEPKEMVSREKKKIGLASSQLSWLSKIGKGVDDLIKVTKEKVIESSGDIANAGSYAADTASDVMQDISKGAESFNDRTFPSKSQKEQQGLIVSELKKSGITDPKAIANILAINKAESRFKPQSENMKYSAKRLMEVFPNRFKDYESAKKVAAGGEKAIAEYLYGAQSKKGKELGNTDLGDGWKYRGRGLNQLTGKANYAKYGKMIGVDLVKNPDLVNDPVIAAKLNAAYYKDRSKGDLSKLKSGDSVMAMTGYTNAEMKAERRGYMAQNYASEEFKSGYAGTPSVDSTTKAVEAKERNVANNTARATRSSTAAIVNAPSVTNNSSSNTTVVAGRSAYRNSLDDQRLQMANGDMASAIS